MCRKTRRGEETAMKIVIAGAGKVGFTVALRLCREGHDITLIDEKREPLDDHRTRFTRIYKYEQIRAELHI